MGQDDKESPHLSHYDAMVLIAGPSAYAPRN
jgi:hypothetical protein